MASGSVSKQETIPSAHSGDKLLIGIVFMLAVNVGQRCVGLVRNIVFCRLLDPADLGAWSLTNSFLEVATPFALLGLTGGFGRFVEAYRRQGRLGDYLRQVLAISAIGVLGCATWILLYPRNFQWIIYDRFVGTHLAVWCAATFLAVVLYTVVAELVMALRHVRVLSTMQFLQSALFTVFGVTALIAFGSWQLLIVGFAAANLLAMLPGIWVVVRYHWSELQPTGQLAPAVVWKRVVPYAASLWVVNMLSGLYETSDRYMLLHLTSGAAEAGQAAVGEYHSTRILPNLLISVAVTLGGILLPYLSADWESGRQADMGRRMRQVLVSACLLLLTGSVGAILCAPLLFEYAFAGRYQTAHAVMHLALMQAVWHGLFLIGQTWLLCAERGRVLVAIMALGVLVNLAGNFLFIPQLGVLGAVLATGLGAMCTLGFLLLVMRRYGWHCGWGTIALCLIAPWGLAAGAEVAALILTTVIVLAGRTSWLLTAEDRRAVDELLVERLRQFGIRIDSLWP